MSPGRQSRPLATVRSPSVVFFWKDMSAAAARQRRHGRVVEVDPFLGDREEVAVGWQIPGHGRERPVWGWNRAWQGIGRAAARQRRLTPRPVPAKFSPAQLETR